MQPFSPPQTFSARTIAEAKEMAAAALGDDFVQIGEPRWESEGGIGGFFEKRRVTISAQRADMIGRLSRLPREAALQEGRDLAGRPEDEVTVEISSDAQRAAVASEASWEKVRASRTATTSPAPLHTYKEPDFSEYAPGGPYERALTEQIERNPAFLLTPQERAEVLERNGIKMTPVRREEPQPAPNAELAATPIFPTLEDRSAEQEVLQPRLAPVRSPFPELDMFEEEEELAVPAAPQAPPSASRSQVRPALTLTTPREAADQVEAQLSPEKLQQELVSKGVPKRLAAELVSEIMLLGGPPMERRRMLRSAVARRFKPAPLAELVTGPVLIVCGERHSGKSSLTARMLQSLASSERQVSVACVGPMSDAGIELVREAAARAGVFFAWTSSPTDLMLKTLAKKSELLVIDLHDGDPARMKDRQDLQLLKKALPGKVQLLAAVAADAPVEDSIDQIDAWLPVGAIALTRADRASTPGSVLELAVAQKRPIAFISCESRNRSNAFQPFDPADFADLLVP